MPLVLIIDCNLQDVVLKTANSEEHINNCTKESVYVMPL